MDESLVIAIDGPSASGKSTVARKVAGRLGYSYVDSGALYRGITWRVLAAGLDPDDPAAVIGLLERLNWSFFVRRGEVCYSLDGMLPGDAIRGSMVTARVSEVAAIPAVRRVVVESLRGMLTLGPLVMEGRDIGTKVFPASPHKFYLYADAGERARRRWLEMKPGEKPPDSSQVLVSLEQRDRKDSTRAVAPLQIALGAEAVDTTAMTVEEVVEHIVRRTGISGRGQEIESGR